jgi:hypothetical protein
MPIRYTQASGAQSGSFYSDALPLVACIRTLLAGRFFSFVKLAPFDRNKGAARGRFTPKDSPLASHPG